MVGRIKIIWKRGKACEARIHTGVNVVSSSNLDVYAAAAAAAVPRTGSLLACGPYAIKAEKRGGGGGGGKIYIPGCTHSYIFRCNSACIILAHR